MNVLIIRFSSIGDIVLTFPVISILKEHYPDSVITFAVKEQYNGLLKENHNIDEIVVLKKKHRQSISGFISFIKQLQRIKFDLVIDLHNNLRSKLLCLFLHGTKKVAYKKNHLQRKLLVLFKHFSGSQTHVVDKYLNTLRKLGIAFDDSNRIPEINPSKKSIRFIKDFFKKNNIDFDKKIIGINPNAKHFTKRWPREKFIGLINKIIHETPYFVLLIGSENDIAYNQKIIGTVGQSKRVLSTAGKIRLRFLPALLSFCDVLVTNDSGPMHVAMAANTPVIAIFGPTVKEFGFYPLHKRDIVLEKQLSCRPCSLHGTDRCFKQHFNCMQGINIEDVYNQIDKLVNS